MTVRRSSRSPTDCTAEGAVPRFVSTTLGSVEPISGEAIEVDVSLEAAPSVLYDAMVLPDGADAVRPAP